MLFCSQAFLLLNKHFILMKDGVFLSGKIKHFFNRWALLILTNVVPVQFYKQMIDTSLIGTFALVQCCVINGQLFADFQPYIWCKGPPGLLVLVPGRTDPSEVWRLELTAFLPVKLRKMDYHDVNITENRNIAASWKESQTKMNK